MLESGADVGEYSGCWRVKRMLESKADVREWSGC